MFILLHNPKANIYFELVENTNISSKKKSAKAEFFYAKSNTKLGRTALRA